MAKPLPSLRRALDMIPSPDPEHPGLLLRDPYQYTDRMVILPPPLVSFLQFFDGEHDEGELKAELVRATGELDVERPLRGLVDGLSGAGFLEDETFAELKATRERAFAESPRREASHAGGAYPEEPEALAATMRRYLDGAAEDGATEGGWADDAEADDAGAARADEGAPLCAIAAPHVSPEGGWRSYRAAFRALAGVPRDRTFVILGTSHYGDPERFGVTQKPFATPLGEAAIDTETVAWLAERGGPGVKMEDYCHAVEHSIEFQVVFLQHLFGAEVRIVPVLCGPFARSTHEGGLPEDDAGVARVLEALRDLAGREGERLFWVLGIDMAHVGRRYGDRPARADQGRMRAVAAADHERIASIAAGDADGFWEQVADGGDDLKWCGASALYTFLRTVQPVRGELLRYEQWNIDRDSVVSFAGLAFSRVGKGDGAC
jgi:AmmeMemoRadiSam system protein B